jgi:hypothetical protein
MLGERGVGADRIAPAMRRRLGAVLGVLLVVGVAWGAPGTPPAAGQADVPAAGPPLSLSGRLQTQGYEVSPAEATYLDADEQVTEQYVRLLVVVQEIAGMPPTAEGWQRAMETYLRAMADLDPDQAPVPPPDGLAPLHARVVAYREALGTAAQQWLGAVRAGDPAWLARGNDAYAAAERARFEWHQALREYYTGEPSPFTERAAAGAAPTGGPADQGSPDRPPSGEPNVPDGPLPPIF